MAANVLSPNGLVPSRHKQGVAFNFSKQQLLIKSGYNAAIGIGDLVIIGTAGNQGYVTIAGNNPASMLGVFAGVLPYFDKTLQATAHGLNGSYQTSANPAADIQCLVYTDPMLVYRVQASSTFAQTWVGNNINFLASSNGVPNAAGISTLSVDGTTSNTTNTLPFRVEGVVGVSGGPQDPANTNPWIEVTLNQTLVLALQGTGI
jgi:hypothetical protein